MKKGHLSYTLVFLIFTLIIPSFLNGCQKNVKLPPETSVKQSDTTQQPGTVNPAFTEGTKPGTANPAYTEDAKTGTANPGGQTTQPEEHGKAAGSIKVKALYLTGWTVGSMEKVEHYVNLAKNTEINSYVIDIKDDDGYVGYESQLPEVREIGGWKQKYDVGKVLKAFHDNNVHIIGRIVCFKDTVLSSRKPELAIKDKRGGLYKTRNTDGKMITWLNPYEKGSWPYLVNIAKEAVQKGFDEIQFDYIRFANDGARQNMDFSAYTKPKHEAIDEFLAYARKELPGVVLSADVFGIICESPADTEGIGQNLETIGMNIDYISPMAYPSHYAPGQIVNKVKFPKPDLDPYGVVFNTLVKAKNRITEVNGYKANVRPYLQDFTAAWIGKGNYQTYGPEQVRQQIKATYDAGYDEWIMWDALNTYSEAAFKKE